MALILIAKNITGDSQLWRADGTADYDVEVSVNRKRFIWTGTIHNHVREDGAAVLLEKIVAAMKAAKV